MHLTDFWYIVATEKELKSKKILHRQILNEWLVVFLDGQGKPVILKDRCLHRSAQLSKGEVSNGCVKCPYHGWTYDSSGEVVSVPSEGPSFKKTSARKLDPYPMLVQQGYIYTRFNREATYPALPFQIPMYKEKGWKEIRLINRFENNVTNCAENFVDIPHTVSVHPGIFRKNRGENFKAKISRIDGAVHADYFNEKANLGYFSWFLNPEGREIQHRDSFFMPNITSVRYEAGENRKFIITSQSVPVTDFETIVFTDLTYDYGFWNWLSSPIVRHQAQKIIDQDIIILKNQMDTIKKYGDKFMNSPADVILSPYGKNSKWVMTLEIFPSKNLVLSFGYEMVSA